MAKRGNWGEVHIDKNIVMPPRGKAKVKAKPHCKWPFAIMDVGDSFFVEKSVKNTRPEAIASYGNKLWKGKRKFAQRPVGRYAVRVWRVA